MNTTSANIPNALLVLGPPVGIPELLCHTRVVRSIRCLILILCATASQLCFISSSLKPAALNTLVAVTCE